MLEIVEFYHIIHLVLICDNTDNKFYKSTKNQFPVHFHID